MKFTNEYYFFTASLVLIRWTLISLMQKSTILLLRNNDNWNKPRVLSFFKCLVAKLIPLNREFNRVNQSRLGQSQRTIPNHRGFSLLSCNLRRHRRNCLKISKRQVWSLLVSYHRAFFRRPEDMQKLLSSSWMSNKGSSTIWTWISWKSSRWVSIWSKMNIERNVNAIICRCIAWQLPGS